MNYVTNDTELTQVAGAIRAAGGTSAPLEYPDEFVAAISAISGDNLTFSQVYDPIKFQFERIYTQISEKITPFESNSLDSDLNLN